VNRPVILSLCCAIVFSQPAHAGILGLIKFPFRCAVAIIKLPCYVLEGNFDEWKETGGE
jgi:hypothetical protein